MNLAQQLNQLRQQAAAQPSRILTVDLGQIAYRQVGQGDAVVFLHGFMADHTSWWPLMQALASDFCCLGLDLLGFGGSSKPDITYDIAVQVRCLRHFAQALHLERFHLVGHSFGGWVAAAYALAHPADLGSLLLLAPAGIRDDAFAGRYQHLRPLLSDPPWLDWVLAWGDPLARLVGKGEALAEIRWLRRALLDQPMALQFLRQRVRPEDAVDTVEERIHELDLPTLVLAAEHDDTIPLWHCQTYTERIPKAQLQILAGASHHIPIRHWQQALDPMRCFLAANP